jgi:hypothetical protein
MRALHPDRKARGYSQKGGSKATRKRLRITTKCLPPPASAPGRINACVIARILCGPAQAVVSLRPPPKSRGRAGRQGPEGPTGLDVSRYLGCPAVPRSNQGCGGQNPQVRRSQGVPRAVFVGLLRSAPGGRSVSGNPASANWEAAYPPLRAQTAPGNSDHAGNRRRWGPATHSGAPGRSGLDRRAARRISDGTSFPGHRSPPRDLETLIRRPSAWDGMVWI